MDWWNVTVFRITGPGPSDQPPFGTGFAVAADGAALLVATCWHVVREIGLEQLHVGGYGPCRVVSQPGDNDLDLALLRVEGLQVPAPLRLASPATRDLAFETYGYEPIGRPLSGTLGAPLDRPHPSNRGVPAWDYYLRDGARELEKVKDGYSGAPVYDPVSGAVVAVITHRQGSDKGFAIDIANLPRIYPQAGAWIETLPQPAVGAPPDHEYAKDLGALVAKTLDHQDQLKAVRDLIARPQGDRTLALVECRSEDWPQDFADHVQWYHGRRGVGASLEEAVELYLGGRDDPRAFWDALVQAVPRREGADPPEGMEAQRALVRGWIGRPGFRVLSVPVNLKRGGWSLPEVIRGAHADLAALGALDPAARVLVLFAVGCDDGAPLWWTWWVRRRLRRLGCCAELKPLRALEKADLEDWHAAFPQSLRSCYCRDRLKMEMLTLWRGRETAKVSHAEARALLLGVGDAPAAVQRARLPNCPY